MAEHCCGSHVAGLRKVEKVLAYITRGDDLLVFEHEGMAEAGIQIPAGTVEPGENLRAAVLREIREEAGLDLDDTARALGRFEWLCANRNEIHGRNFFHFEVDTDEQGWRHTVSGSGEDRALVFRYYWMAIEKAAAQLAADQGAYLHLL